MSFSNLSMVPSKAEVSRAWCEGLDTQETIVMKKIIVRDYEFMCLLWRFFPFSFRLTDRNSRVIAVCKERGWRLFDNQRPEHLCYQSWNLWWRTSPVKSIARPNRFLPWQTINHIPNAANCCQKDVLVRYFRRMSKMYPQLYNFTPLSFVLPTDFQSIVTASRIMSARVKQDNPYPEEAPKLIWIGKPVGKSQGRGIFMVEKFVDFTYDSEYVVQHYIHRPYLINGYKWDLRIYVCITCNNPLTIYSYSEGIARFATSKYDVNRLDNHFAHLTNSSLNKRSPSYHKPKDSIGTGSKWNLAQIRSFFRKKHIADYALWQQIWSILVLTIIGDGKMIAQQIWDDHGFQLMGFDILIDKYLNAHLLEVNLHPSLGSDRCVADLIKSQLLHELFDLLGFPDGRNFLEPAVGPLMMSDKELCSKVIEAMSISEHLNMSSGPGPRARTAPGKKRPSRTSYTSTPKASGMPQRSFTANTLASSYKQKPPKKSSATTSRQSVRPPWNRDSSGRKPKAVVVTAAPIEPEQLIQPPRPGPSRLAARTSNLNLRNTTSPTPSNSFRPLVVDLPTLQKSVSRLRLPINGPGMTFLPRNWNSSPSACGRWTKIFPFDQVTEECSTFGRPQDSRDAILRVGQQMRTVLQMVREDMTKNDASYDEILEAQMTSRVWHPVIHNQNTNPNPKTP